MLHTLKEIYKYKNFLKELIQRDFKKKYYKSVLGVFWTILNPLLMMSIITLVFSTLFKRNIPYFPVYYLCGFLIFNFNSEATNTSLHAILGNSALIQKIYIPSYLFVISTTTLAMINKLISMIPMILVMIILRAPFHWTFFLIPVLLIPLYLFSLGLGLALASMAVYFRDLFYLYGIFISMLIYLSCIFYPIDIIPERFRFLWNFNPIYPFISTMRGLVLYGTLPSLMTVMYILSYTILSMGIGINIYRSLEKNFILHF